MTEQELKKFWEMVREFENMPDKHQYALKMHYCDGTTETMEVFVDCIAIRILRDYLISCGIYAKAKLIEKEVKGK